MQSYVLLSGGIDSSTCLAIAFQQADGGARDVIGVSIDYGQRHSKEIIFAKQQCDYYGMEHKIIPMHNVVPRTMLTDHNEKIPNISYDEIKGVSPTYVPFRNGLMLAAITSLASGKDNQRKNVAVYFGAHAEDAANWAYPDCTPEFIGAMANAILIGSYSQVRLHTPLMWLTKDKIIKLGQELGVPWNKTWSCYAGEQVHCGVCPTCRARKQAFEKAGVPDPTDYAA